MHLKYSYDSASQRILAENISRPDFSEKAIYDSLLRLTSFLVGKYKNGSIDSKKLFHYEYDALGNRIFN